MNSEPSILALDSLDPTVVVGKVSVDVTATSEGAGFLEPEDLVEPSPRRARAIFIDRCVRVVGDDDFGSVNTRHLQAHQAACHPGGE